MTETSQLRHDLMAPERNNTDSVQSQPSCMPPTPPLCKSAAYPASFLPNTGGLPDERTAQQRNTATWKPTRSPARSAPKWKASICRRTCRTTCWRKSAPPCSTTWSSCSATRRSPPNSNSVSRGAGGKSTCIRSCRAWPTTRRSSKSSKPHRTRRTSAGRGTPTRCSPRSRRWAPCCMRWRSPRPAATRCSPTNTSPTKACRTA